MKPFKNLFLNTLTAQKGLSLIELMVSMAIGLLLLASLTTLFVSQSKTRLELDKQNRMIDNGRYALDLLSENLRLAGFYGELDPSSVLVSASLPDPCTTIIIEPPIASGESVLPFHVQGINAATASSTLISVPTCIPSTLKIGSDVLVIRRAHTTAIASSAAVANTTYLQVSLCTPKTGGAELSYYLRKAPSNYNLSKKTCITPNSGIQADLRRFLVQIYFIDSNNLAGDGIPTLKMAELDAASNFVITPLVEGIEYMQIDYGIDGKDTNADGIADEFDGIMDGSYVSCSACDSNQWAHVVSLKLNLISRNLETTTGFSDAKIYNLGTAGSVTPGGNYKRLAYTQVIRLTNPASRKE